TATAPAATAPPATTAPSTQIELEDTTPSPDGGKPRTASNGTGPKPGTTAPGANTTTKPNNSDIQGLLNGTGTGPSPNGLSAGGPGPSAGTLSESDIQRVV